MVPSEYLACRDMYSSIFLQPNDLISGVSGTFGYVCYLLTAIFNPADLVGYLAWNKST